MKCHCDVLGCENRLWVEMSEDTDTGDVVITRYTPDFARLYGETRVTLPARVAKAIKEALDRL